MNNGEFYESLLELSKPEIRLKEYYEKNHTYMPVTQLYTQQDGIDWRQWGLSNIRDSHILLEQTQMDDEFELTEEDYFSSAYDIRILRNLRYSEVAQHQHVFFEMMYLVTGQCENIIDGKTTMLKAGDLCIIPPKVIHSIKVNTDSVLLNILIRTSTFTDAFVPLLRDSNILSDFFNEILYSNTYRKYLLFHTEKDTEILDYVLRMFQEQQGGQAYFGSIMNGLLMAFFGKLLQRHSVDVEYPALYVEKLNLVPKITAYIKKNCKEASLDDCAANFHFNPQYLSALLKKNTGKPFSVLLTEARMEAAKKALLHTDHTVKQISNEVGYQDEAYFMKVFKKHYNCTPSEYRNQEGR